MLAKRLIPCLDVHNGRVVKGINFVNLIDAGDPVAQARVYDAEGADELVFLDITATHEARQTVRAMARAVADQVFIPFTVGGGIRTVDDMRAMLRAGADKISLNSAAVRSPDLITQGAAEFGSQAVVVAIDARRKRSEQSTVNSEQLAVSSEEHLIHHSPFTIHHSPFATLQSPSWEVVINGGRVTTGLDVVQWAIEAEQRGAGEILLTSMDADGTKASYDIALTRAVAEAVNIPVIASGGAGRVEHFAEALTEGGAAAALAASLFHFNELRIRDVKAYLREKGIAVR
ncbi:MAG: imidazole glycerol phosphate synthase subunit HisF [Chloroflexi bacterium]|nr:imidazole glycerol phosphate synthase subunit HisF [Chloroflexota bacterium]MBP8059244.1 imidazole glycerol phosphate synthase subunit HisF [Chloroflexota bacterium]